MQRCLWLCLALLSACDTTLPGDVATARAPLPVFVGHNLPVTVPTALGGTVDARLGVSLSACDPGGGWVAGAPGIDHLYSSSAGGLIAVSTAVDPDVELGLTVQCERGAARGLIGGRGGLWRVWADGGSGQLLNETTLSLATAVGAPTLAGVASADGGGAVWSLGASPVTSNPMPTLLTTSGSGSFATSLWYFPAGGRFVAGDPKEVEVAVFKREADGGATRQVTYTGNTQMDDHGRTVLVGDVLPAPGPEVIVGAPSAGEVRIYAQNAMPLILTGVNTSDGNPPVHFGAALALEPENAGGGLRALWVGEPGTSRIYRCLGTQCDVFESTAVLNSRFGAALEFDGRTLVVGAPNYSSGMTRSGEGAVFEFTPDSGTLDGVAMDCTPSVPCVAGCQLGRCVGTVLCVRTLESACAPGQTCIGDVCVVEGVDAGSVDAGAPDAGDDDGGRDAGAPDAGDNDAGLPDAGVVDGGRPDAGDADAGTPDGGDDDAGTPDAGEPGTAVFISGCTTSPGAGMLWLLIIGLWRGARATKHRS